MSPDVFVAEVGKTLRTVLWVVLAVEAMSRLDELVRFLAQ